MRKRIQIQIPEGDKVKSKSFIRVVVIHRAQSANANYADKYISRLQVHTQEEQARVY